MSKRESVGSFHGKFLNVYLLTEFGKKKGTPKGASFLRTAAG
jgi:hypothetical protein